MMRFATPAVFLFAYPAAPLQGATAPLLSAGQVYQLKATPKTVAWGYYAAKAPPALRMFSGDSVEVEMLVTSIVPHALKALVFVRVQYRTCHAWQPPRGD